jgi:hypothetical protein
MLPAYEKQGDRDLVAVLETTDPALLPIARSALQAAGIPHVVQGEAGINIFPLGAAATRVTRRLTGASILVDRENFEEAKALLETPAEEAMDSSE